jgi:hypothetical protein
MTTSIYPKLSDLNLFAKNNEEKYYSEVYNQTVVDSIYPNLCNIALFTQDIQPTCPLLNVSSSTDADEEYATQLYIQELKQLEHE